MPIWAITALSAALGTKKPKKGRPCKYSNRLARADIYVVTPLVPSPQAHTGHVIEDSGHTVRLDENSHLVLFPTFHFQPVYHLMGDQPHGQWRHLEVDATGRRPGSGIWLVVGWLPTMLVGSRGRVGLVTPTPNGHLPALFGGPFHVYNWGSGLLSVG
jgi:hypothetical protein